MSDLRPTLAELINRAKAEVSAELRVGLPAVVESYDAATQLADVKPQVKDTVENEDGSITQVPVPVIVGVPVQMPGAGGMRITFPVRKGDTVWLCFGDRSIDAWLSAGGDTAPADLRRHNLTDAVAFLGFHPTNAPWSGAEDGVITIGSDSGAAEFVALAQHVSDRLTELKNAISSAAVLAGDGGATFKANLIAALATWPTSVASATVKVKG